MFGHDLLRAAKAFFAANERQRSIGDELVATDVTDFSPYLLKIRQARPDVVCCNLAGNQVTNLIKQYAEFGLPYPIVGFNLNTADAWAAGEGNLSGTWPTVWHHDLDTPGSKAFVAGLHQEERQAAGEPRLDRVRLAQDDGAGHERDQVDRHRQADRVLREGNPVRRPQGAQGLLPVLGSPARAGGLSRSRVKAKGQAKDKWDFLALGRAQSRQPNEPLEVINPTKEQNPCSLSRSRKRASCRAARSMTRIARRAGSAVAAVFRPRD